MVTYLAHHQIDFEKYNNCIRNAKNHLLYAESWYLNIVAPNWDLLVLSDYEAVMPLPKREKYGIHYLFVPPWVQQLGVFSTTISTPEIVLKFIENIPSKFRYQNIYFNYKNTIKRKFVTIRYNYTLPLYDSYGKIYANFRKGRKSSLQNAKQQNLVVKNCKNADKLITIFKENKGQEIKRNKNDYDLLTEIVLIGLMQNKVAVYEVFDKDENLLGGAIFLISKHRITYLFSAINELGRKLNSNSFLINTVIEKYAKTNIIFDFEGSMVPNIASFFKSFGAVKEHYYDYKPPFKLF